jgi:hypothetical protein
LPLEALPAKALAIVALAAILAAAALGAWGLRAPYLISQVCATLAIGGATIAARETIVGLGLPFLSRFSVALTAAALPMFVVSAYMRRREQRPGPSDREGRDCGRLRE